MSSLSSSIDWLAVCAVLSVVDFFKFFFIFFVSFSCSFLFSVFRCFLFLFEVCCSSSGFSSFSYSANSSSYKTRLTFRLSKSQNLTNTDLRFFFTRHRNISLKRKKETPWIHEVTIFLSTTVKLWSTLKEPFLIECRKTTHKGRRAKRSKNWFWFYSWYVLVLLLIGYKGARVF